MHRCVHWGNHHPCFGLVGKGSGRPAWLWGDPDSPLEKELSLPEHNQLCNAQALPPSTDTINIIIIFISLADPSFPTRRPSILLGSALHHREYLKNSPFSLQSLAGSRNEQGVMIWGLKSQNWVQAIRRGKMQPDRLETPVSMVGCPVPVLPAPPRPLCAGSGLPCTSQCCHL